MEKLTAKEEEIMNLFWDKGPSFVRELLDCYKEGPRKPHFNTLSTIVRGLEDKGFLSHESFGSSYRYHTIISKDDYKKGALDKVVNKYFNSSYLGVISSLIDNEELSVEELKDIIKQIESK